MLKILPDGAQGPGRADGMAQSRGSALGQAAVSGFLTSGRKDFTAQV